MLLHMNVIFTSCYCFLSKCAQYDPSCRRALKHYSFIHSCAVTRAMAKKAFLKNSNSDIDLTDTFIGQYFNNEIKKSLDPSLSDTQTDSLMFLSFITTVY